MAVESRTSSAALGETYVVEQVQTDASSRPADVSLLDQIVSRTAKSGPQSRRAELKAAALVRRLFRRTSQRPSSRLDKFKEAVDSLAAARHWSTPNNSTAIQSLLRLWFGDVLPADVSDLRRALQQNIATIDTLVTSQVNAILHHPQFQQLEASWRGLQWLQERVADEVDQGAKIKLKVLNASWKDLTKNFERAIDFDQSFLFQKVYESEFGTPGGEPFGLLLGDYEIAPGINGDDLLTLRGISQVAAASFCPFVCGTSPQMFGLQDWRGLERHIQLENLFSGKAYIPWRSFREEEDSRFVGLVLPRVLRRVPWSDRSQLHLHQSFGFVANAHPDDIPIRFREDVSASEIASGTDHHGPDKSRYLWGNAAYAFGEVCLRSFADSAWFADIRGVQRDVVGGGLVTDLPVHSFGTDRLGVAPKISTDVVVTDMLEKRLSEIGFISLCHCKDTEYSAFYSTPTIQAPKAYDSHDATMNARISAMLQYMLCVSRFTHYIKVLVRDKVGRFIDASECENYLHQWLMNYKSDRYSSNEVKAARPLREAEVQVRESQTRPGSFDCRIRLWPHYELDELVATVEIKTQLSRPRG